jgi:dTDP-4-dehydrorhamnose 3,5-epimerase
MTFKIIDTELEGLKIIEPKLFTDSRGYFFESFNSQKMSDAGIKEVMVQDNISKSKKGVLRGLHYQLKPFGQAKFLTVLSGRILDVAVDIRIGSPTYGRHFSIELTGGSGRLIFIPEGFAHGFVSLEDETIILYKVGNYYSPENERGIRYNDPDLKIDWKLDEKELIITARDLSFPLFSEAENNFRFGE